MNGKIVILIKYIGEKFADETSKRIDKIVDYFWNKKGL